MWNSLDFVPFSWITPTFLWIKGQHGGSSLSNLNMLSTRCFKWLNQWRCNGSIRMVSKPTSLVRLVPSGDPWSSHGASIAENYRTTSTTEANSPLLNLGKFSLIAGLAMKVASALLLWEAERSAEPSFAQPKFITSGDWNPNDPGIFPGNSSTPKVTCSTCSTCSTSANPQGSSTWCIALHIVHALFLCWGQHQSDHLVMWKTSLVLMGDITNKLPSGNLT